jgi:6-pyruvoyltetrahydropterin/6-carboxytetrahydropterin synthase
MERWRISKRMEIAGSHQLSLPYESKCQGLHGHNWYITVYCEADKLTEYGMIVDFAKVKKEIHGFLDHGYLNDLLPGINPTAENIAKWICDKVDELCDVGYCCRVDVQESEGNIATYERKPD